MMISPKKKSSLPLSCPGADALSKRLLKWDLALPSPSLPSPPPFALLSKQKMTIICSYGESSAWSKSVYCYVYDISLFVIGTQKKGQRFILYIRIYMTYFLSKENKKWWGHDRLFKGYLYFSPLLWTWLKNTQEAI